jgi:threonine/homoserine/homoserine lactone efflux protein
VHLSVLSAFAVALAIAVAIPGPGIFGVVSCAIGRGFREAMAMICGVIIGDLTYFYLAVLGMAALAHSMGEFFIVVKFAGAAYLIWLGVKLWRQQPADAPPMSESGVTRRGFKRSLLGGIALTVSNPKTIGFYAGLLPTFIDLKKLTPGEAAVMGAIVVLVVGTIPAAYAYAAARSRRFFQHPAKMKVMQRTAGTMMIGAGVTVASQ